MQVYMILIGVWSNVATLIVCMTLTIRNVAVLSAQISQIDINV